MWVEVLVTRAIPEAGLEVLAGAGVRYEVWPHDRPMTAEELRAGVAGRRGVLCLVHDRIDEGVLDAAGEGCGIFANMGVGFDNVDVGAATARGVMVTNTPGVLTDATADLAFGLMLAASRRVAEGDRLVRRGDWRGWGPLQMLGVDVTGATLGIVGAGRIGTGVARRAAGFGMRILYADVRGAEEMERLGGKRVELAALLGESDFVSIHVNFTEGTRQLIGAREMALMKRTSCLVNTSRGAVVDEGALVAALKAGRPGFAGLDVYENEPALAEGLAELENVVLLPHLGSATARTRSWMAVMAAEDMVAALGGGRPANLVNPEVQAR